MNRINNERERIKEYKYTKEFERKKSIELTLTLFATITFVLGTLYLIGNALLEPESISPSEMFASFLLIFVSITSTIVLVKDITENYIILYNNGLVLFPPKINLFNAKVKAFIPFENLERINIPDGYSEVFFYVKGRKMGIYVELENQEKAVEEIREEYNQYLETNDE